MFLIYVYYSDFIGKIFMIWVCYLFICIIGGVWFIVKLLELVCRILLLLVIVLIVV